MTTIYDHPLYYDILFGWDRSVETDFYQRVFERSGVAVGSSVLEVACGTGQVALRLARLGWRVSGFDLRPSMVAFLRERAIAQGLHIEVFCGDMTEFSTDTVFSAAYNPMSSFRLLHSDEQAEAHLRAMAGALRPGGVYVLDLDLLSDADEIAITTDESWDMTRGGVTVRAENDGVHVDDGGERRVLEWGPEAHLRGYTWSAFADRVANVPSWEIEACFPETARDEVSQFDSDAPANPPVAGRTMVLLRRV